jgi:cyclin-dependent kinase 8/11
MMMMKSYRERRDKQRIRIQDQYEVLGFISSGTYGKVYKAIHHAGNVVAIKKFKPGNKSIIILYSFIPMNSSYIYTYYIPKKKKKHSDREGEVAYTGISQSACREIMVSNITPIKRKEKNNNNNELISR